MKTQNEFPAFHGRIGAAQRDITPPVGIYNRNWGAAMSDVAVGIHRPLYGSVVAIFGEKDPQPLLLVCIDLGWFKTPTDEQYFRLPILMALGLDPTRVMICLSHSHAGPSICLDDDVKPGGQYIRPFVDFVASSLVDAAKEAVAKATPSVLTWRYGKCDLAVNRDMRDPTDPKRILVGYNPDVVADDTLLVGRVTRADDHRPVATIVNYACHPTTLAWDNNLISPDYVGAMREVVESATSGAPVAFVLGACGDLSPAEQYSGDAGLADRHGVRLGHAVVSTLYAMTPPGTALRFIRPVESGARLGLWGTGPAPVDNTVEARIYDVPLALKPQPPLAEVEQKLRECTDRPIGERLARKIKILKFIGSGTHLNLAAWSWRIGPALFFGQPNEAYELFQTTLRNKWPDRPVVAINLVNGSCGYLVPAEKSDPDLYTFWQSPFETDGFRSLTERSIAAGEALIGK